MRNTPVVSVVMSCYNSEKYVKEAIESVLSQTFRDFEFVIWDDGSTDGTKEIVESFQDERIRYIYHENTGLGMALKLACAEARGKYIARMDSDDICLPERFVKETEFLDEHEDYVLVSSAVNYIDENGNYIGRTFPCSDDRVLKAVLKDSSMIVHPMAMIRKEAYEASGGYVPIRYLEDGLFWSILGRQGKFYNISQPLGNYRLLANSLGHSRNKYDDVFKAFRQKMSRDEFVLDSDVEFYNEFLAYSKNFKKEQSLERIEGKVSSEEKLYNIMKRFVGHRLSEKIIVGLKNLFYRIKLHC